MSHEELKPCPCPFCGSTKIVRSGGMDMNGSYDQLLCRGCGARGPEEREDAERNQHDLWNTRPTESAARLAQREADAKIAEGQLEAKRNPDSYREGWNDACWAVTAAIRGEGQG